MIDQSKDVNEHLSVLPEDWRLPLTALQNAEATTIAAAARKHGVAGFVWNGWQVCSGISGSFRLEYALKVKYDAPVIW
jgi:hypothetical protein